MANNRFSFAVAMNLYTEQFKKGSKEVVNSLRNIQYRLAALVTAFGAGAYSLGNFVSSVIDTARQLGKAQTALKNVSDSTAQYNDNLRYLNQTAKKYGQDIVTLTGSYAKFTAAAKQSNINLYDQRNIFESILQAGSALALSADDVGGAMLAVTQMMSKGKITAEELRLQLGERIPGAVAIMAKAIGVSVGKLDEMMKKGELLSKDVLPLFAQQLKATFGNFNTNNVEGAINNLKTVFAGLVNSSGVQDFIKTFVQALTKGLKVVADNFTGIMQGALAVGIGAIVNPIGNFLSNAVKKYKNSLRAIEATTKFNNSSDVVRNRGGLYPEAADEFYNHIRNKEVTLKTYKNFLSTQIKDAENIVKALEKEKKNFKPEKSPFTVKPTEFDSKGLDKAKETLAVMKSQYSAINELTSAGYGNLKIINGELKSSTVLLGKTKAAFSAVGNFFKQIWENFRIGIIVAGIAFVIEKVIAWRNEQARINNLVKEAANNVDSVNKAFSSGGAEYEKNRAELEAMARAIKDSQIPLERRKEIYKALTGFSGDIKTITESQLLNEKAISKAITDRLELLRKEAVLKAKADEYGKALVRRDELRKEIASTPEYREVGNNQNTSIKLKTRKFSNLEKELSNVGEIINSYESDYQAYQDQLTKGSFSTDSPVETKELDGFSKYWKEYLDELEKLENQYKNGAISAKQFSDSHSELSKKSIELIGGLKLTAEQAELFNGLFQFVIPEAVEDTIDEFTKLENQLRSNVITTEDYFKELQNLTESEIKELGSKSDLNDAEKVLLGVRKEQLQILKDLNKQQKFSSSTGSGRDTTFDYKEITGKKSDALRFDILDKEYLLKQAEETFEELKQNFEDGEALLQEVIDAEANKLDLEKALKLSKIKLDIKNLNKELGKGLVESLGAIANAFDQLNNSIESLGDMSDKNGWEKFITVINAAVQAINTISTVMQAFSVLRTVLNQKEMAQSRQKIVANTAEAASEAGKSGSKLPFPFNLIAIGSSIAATLAMFAAIPKFKDGGIVSGATLGIMGEYAGASSNPEVIAPLNKLKSLMGDNSGVNLSGEVKFKISGKDLEGVLLKNNKRNNRV